MDRRQCETVEFAGAQRVVHVCARIVRAGVAVAALLKRTEIVLELRALDVVAAVAREDRAVSSATGGGDAVERIATVLHAGEDVVDRGDAEHMARTAFRHRVTDPGAGVADDALLDRAADADAVEIERSDLFGGMPAQILVIRALHYAVERLIRLAETFLGKPLVLGHATLRPAVGAFHGTFLVAAGVHQRGQLVESEHDVGADLVLDAHGDFGGEPVQRAVERRLERHTVLVHEREPLLAFRDHVVRFHAGDVHGERLLEARAE